MNSYDLIGGVISPIMINHLENAMKATEFIEHEWFYTQLINSDLFTILQFVDPSSRPFASEKILYAYNHKGTYLAFLSALSAIFGDNSTAIITENPMEIGITINNSNKNFQFTHTTADYTHVIHNNSTEKTAIGIRLEAVIADSVFNFVKQFLPLGVKINSLVVN